MTSINNKPDNRFVVVATVSPNFIRRNQIDPDSIFQIEKSLNNNEIKIFLNVDDHKLAKVISFLSNNNITKSSIEVYLIADWNDSPWNETDPDRQKEVYNFMLDVDAGRIGGLSVSNWWIFSSKFA